MGDRRHRSTLNAFDLNFTGNKRIREVAWPHVVTSTNFYKPSHVTERVIDICGSCGLAIRGLIGIVLPLIRKDGGPALLIKRSGVIGRYLSFL